MLIQFDDPNSNYVNKGVSEFLRMYSVMGDLVSFETAKVEHYGSTAIINTLRLGLGILMETEHNSRNSSARDQDLRRSE